MNDLVLGKNTMPAEPVAAAQTHLYRLFDTHSNLDYVNTKYA